MLNITKTIIGFVMDILETVVFVGSMFIVVYLFILTPNQVKGASMEPTFDSGDYILTSRVTYKFRRLERGDVVVFKSPKNHDIEYIKRIIGLPGETVEVGNGVVAVYNEEGGQVLAESNYLYPYVNTPGEARITLGDDEYFVMGDNRPASSDSRRWGPLSKEYIVGRVFLRAWPFAALTKIETPEY